MNLMTATEAVVVTTYGEGFELDLKQPSVTHGRWSQRSWRHHLDILLIGPKGDLLLFEGMVRDGFGSFKTAENNRRTTMSAIENPTPATIAIEIARHDLVIVIEDAKN